MGRRLPASLAAVGITTPLQLRDACPTMIRQRFNVVLQRTVLELRGTPCLDFEQDSPDSKTICTSRSFGRAVECYEELAEALTAYMSRSAEKMRRQGLATAAMVVMLTTNKHRPEDAQYYATRHVRLSELETVRGRMGLPVERDLWFEAGGPLSAYAATAHRAERIVELESVA